MANQRGNVAVYLLFSLAVATGAGYGVYRLMRDHKPAVAANDHVDVQTAPAPTPRPSHAPSDELPVEPPQAVDPAENTAVAPEDIADPPKDTVLLGTPGVAGGLEPASVERMVKRYVGRYDRCMRHTHEKYRMRRGALRVTFVINATGSVDYASAQATDVEEDLANCVLDVFKKLRFDKSSDGAKVKVVYPMAFVPAQGGDAGDPYPAEPPADDPLAQ
ncbi:MAG TPA: AgmX/PglI C-terminal domain-containing protein [Kofleriaceae bacterium]|nr:AgmX/PglI C-terminal domain-containing protein [Kofleriaceae bacterium]